MALHVVPGTSEQGLPPQPPGSLLCRLWQTDWIIGELAANAVGAEIVTINGNRTAAVTPLRISARRDTCGIPFGFGV